MIVRLPVRSRSVVDRLAEFGRRVGGGVVAVQTYADDVEAAGEDFDEDAGQFFRADIDVIGPVQAEGMIG